MSMQYNRVILILKCGTANTLLLVLSLSI